MESFVSHSGIAAPLLQANIDTDAIIPSREMKSVSKTGLAAGLFANWRYTDVDRRIDNPDFVLNQPRYRGATILLAGANFGCGSSREHAVWALREFGFRCIVAPSFGAIFRGNCIRNGVLPATVDEAGFDTLAAAIDRSPKPDLAVDLVRCLVSGPQGIVLPFTLPAEDRDMLLEGLDEIGVTLKRMTQIEAFEALHKPRRPWLFRSRVAAS